MFFNTILPPPSYVSSATYLLLLITLTFMVDRTIKGTSSRGVVLSLHIIVVTFTSIMILQSVYLFVDRVRRGMKYIQEQAEITSLVPVFSGQGPDPASNNRASLIGTASGRTSLHTTRRQVHANRKSFQLPKEASFGGEGVRAFGVWDA